MSKLIDLIGLRYGRLAVTAAASKLQGRTAWFCICDCGQSVTVSGNRLRTGNTVSCGCAKRDALAGRSTHGQTRASVDRKTYNVWVNMKARCLNPLSTNYAFYGGRGIAVSPEWLDFARFLEDMGPAPSGTSIDRIDNALGYGPANCRWASRSVQANNKRNSRLIKHQGRTQTQCHWAAEFGLSESLLYKRLKAGWSVEKALTFPVSSSNGGRAAQIARKAWKAEHMEMEA